MHGGEDHLSKQVQDEFRRNHWVDRLPLYLAKLICFILMTFTSYLSAVSGSLEDRVSYIGFTLILAAIYTNFAYLKYELKELFEPPIRYYGYPILFVSTLCCVWYEYLRW